MSGKHLMIIVLLYLIKVTQTNDFFLNKFV